MTDTQYSILSWSAVFLLIGFLTAYAVFITVYLWAFIEVALIFSSLVTLGGSSG